MLVWVVCAVAMATDPISDWLDAAFPVADGFDAPGSGAALADGRVAAVADDVVTVEHVFYVNHERREVHSTYRGTRVASLKVGDLVKRGQAIAAKSTLDGGPLPTTLFVPQREPVLVVVDSGQQRMRVIADGVAHEFQVGLGQAAGCKVRQGDLKTPCGMYFVTGKSTGPFTGPYAAYYGGHFIKLNYPNPYDAERGASADQRRAIQTAWSKCALTPQNTRLGGGIGFHGWAEEWPDTNTMRGSWGCVTFHNRDIAKAYALIPVGTMVVIF